ncbi:MAG: NUDIX domain-containing protein [Elusimicrobiota bacterium]
MKQLKRFEFSAGGVVVDGDRKNKKVLMIKAKNLVGEIVWTLPKGHVEKNENATSTAIREVREETGYRCEITGVLDTVQYWFRFGGKLTKKTVKWFLMKPDSLKQCNKPDAIEVGWFSRQNALAHCVYESDKKLILSVFNNKRRKHPVQY